MNLSKNQIKLIRSLGQKKFRQKYQYFVAEGSKIVLDILQASANIKLIYAIPEWIEEFESSISSVRELIVPISHKELKQISFLKTPNSVLVLLKMPNQADISLNKTSGYHFYADRIQNPGNLGTLIRIADWFGFDSVITSADSVDFYNEKTIQATMGAFLHVDLVQATLDSLEYNHLITTSLQGRRLYDSKMPNNGIVVISNEGQGISPEVLGKSTMDLCIPSHPNSGSDSLNASVAAGIIASYVSQTRDI